MATGVVSRPAEQRAVDELLAASVLEPAALVLTGEAGIGKTTVWLDGLERAGAAGFRVLSARIAAAESVLAYAGLAALLDSVAPDVLAGLPAPQQLALDRVLLKVSADGPTTDQRAVGAAVSAVLARLAETSPVLVAVDDVQWLDAPSMQVLSSVARRLAGPIGILAAVRTGSPDITLQTWLELPRPDSIRRITLQPLSVGALHAVVSDRVGRSFSRPTMLQIHQTSGGNPFYAVELARAVDDGVWSSTSTLPSSLAELVQLRIGHLDDAALSALLAAAALADPTVELVAKATDSTPAEVVAVLEEAEDKGIVTIDGHRLRFTHPLLTRGVYGGSGPAQRRRMHRRLAEILTEPELRARHLALASAAGDPHTLSALDAAAHTARQRGAPAFAAELLDLAIGLGGDTAERRIMMASNNFDAGDVSGARGQLTDVIDSLGPGGMRAGAMTLLAVVRLHDDGFTDAAALLERAVNEGDDPASRVRSLVMLGYALFNAGETESAMAHIETAVVEAAELGHRPLISQTLGMRTTLRFVVGDGLDSESLSRALHFDDDDEDIPVAARVRVQHALLRAWSGDYDAADAELSAIRRRCAERGEETELIFLGFHAGLVNVWRSDLVAADLVAAELVERALQLDGDLPMFIALTVRAMVGAYAGRVDEVRTDVANALAAGRRCNSQRLVEWPSTTLAFLDVSLGDHAAALTVLEPMVAKLLAAPRETEIMSASFVPDAVEALCAVGRADEAVELVELFEDNARRLNRPWTAALGARCRATVLAAQGDTKGATEAVTFALERHRDLAMPFELARTELLAGQIARRDRRREPAGVLLRRALAAFEELGMPLWAARARAELSRVTVAVRRTDGLTATERRVAELAASGATNRDMASNLFISPKTVEANLTRIYRKLNIHSRAELARIMARLDD